MNVHLPAIPASKEVAAMATASRWLYHIALNSGVDLNFWPNDDLYECIQDFTILFLAESEYSVMNAHAGTWINHAKTLYI